MFAGSALALTYTEVGNLPGALSAIEQAMALDRGRFPYFWGVPLGMRARLHVRMGELAEARAASQASHANFRPEVVNTADFVLLADAELALAEGRTEEAVAACDELLEAARKPGRQVAVPETLLLKGRGLRAGGLLEPAREALVQAIQAAEALRSSRTLWQILLEQSRLEAGAENPQEAAGLRARAGAVVGQLAASLDDPELRRQFEARPEIQEALGR
jgi:tetratricopeptide (TPR) repeat protein